MSLIAQARLFRIVQKWHVLGAGVTKMHVTANTLRSFHDELSGILSGVGFLARKRSGAVQHCVQLAGQDLVTLESLVLRMQQCGSQSVEEDTARVGHFLNSRRALANYAIEESAGKSMGAIAYFFDTRVRLAIEGLVRNAQKTSRLP